MYDVCIVYSEYCSMVILCSFIGCFHLGVVSLPQLPSCERYLLEALCALDHQARGRWEISRNKKILLPSFSWEENLRSKVYARIFQSHLNWTSS